ncbi:hypothetical protein B0H14DRAFT_2639410 [Mycena olivaceomarginata]|nr:hypothetical protein B0H14DRAFT_2639410 [Mycena olivaceomarginata]
MSHQGAGQHLGRFISRSSVRSGRNPEPAYSPRPYATAHGHRMRDYSRPEPSALSRCTASPDIPIWELCRESLDAVGPQWTSGQISVGPGGVGEPEALARHSAKPPRICWVAKAFLPSHKLNALLTNSIIFSSSVSRLGCQQFPLPFLQRPPEHNAPGAHCARLPRRPLSLIFIANKLLPPLPPSSNAQLNTMVYVMHVLLIVTGDWSLSPCHQRRRFPSPAPAIVSSFPMLEMVSGDRHAAALILAQGYVSSDIREKLPWMCAPGGPQRAWNMDCLQINVDMFLGPPASVSEHLAGSYHRSAIGSSTCDQVFDVCQL